MAKKQSKLKRLAPPPTSFSRKRARKVTTQFHQLTRTRAKALQSGQDVSEIDRQLENGRREYQRASQISTSFHSTSKWVLGDLAQNGMLYGIGEAKRPTRLLEVGAINTELLDAAQPKKETSRDKNTHRLDVRSIDIHSMHPDCIEEADFLEIPQPVNLFDVIVCSMVLNCVATAEDRGRMIVRLHRFLQPDGRLYLTIPKTCLTLSPFMDRERFLALLQAVGFRLIASQRDSPKLAYFVLSKADSVARIEKDTIDEKWAVTRKIRRGAKFKNDFSVVVRSAFFEDGTVNK